MVKPAAAKKNEFAIDSLLQFSSRHPHSGPVRTLVSHPTSSPADHSKAAATKASGLKKVIGGGGKGVPTSAEATKAADASSGATSKVIKAADAKKGNAKIWTHAADAKKKAALFELGKARPTISKPKPSLPSAEAANKAAKAEVDARTKAKGCVDEEVTIRENAVKSAKSEVTLREKAGALAAAEHRINPNLKNSIACAKALTAENKSKAKLKETEANLADAKARQKKAGADLITAQGRLAESDQVLAMLKKPETPSKVATADWLPSAP